MMFNVDLAHYGVSCAKIGFLWTVVQCSLNTCVGTVCAQISEQNRTEQKFYLDINHTVSSLSNTFKNTYIDHTITY